MRPVIELLETWQSAAAIMPAGGLVEIKAVVGELQAAIDQSPPETRTTFCWGLRDGHHWLVVYRNGEPHAAYHQQYGRIDATRQTFERWTPDADACSPDHADAAKAHDIEAKAQREIDRAAYKTELARMETIGEKCDAEIARLEGALLEAKESVGALNKREIEMRHRAYDVFDGARLALEKMALEILGDRPEPKDDVGV